MHEAAAADDAKGIALLLRLPEHKSGLNSFDIAGQTPLQVAVDCGSSNALEALIKHGADVYAYDRQGLYTAHSLAQAYFTATVDANQVPLLKMIELLGDKLSVSLKKDKKQKKETAANEQNSVSKKIDLRRRRRREITPELPPLPDQDQAYDPYLLNV